jgi:isopropylmalate/homocitrate/citramalate synthase
MIFEYAQLRGTLDGMEPQVVTELAEYFEKEIGHTIPPMTPFVGKNFNVTRAGIHADGLLKNEEIYNIFDTAKFLNRPVKVVISNTSGLAGIVHWLNDFYKKTGNDKFEKTSPVALKVKDWVDAQYEGGRVTSITDEEMATVSKLAID